jgi:hypothetical protein
MHRTRTRWWGHAARWTAVAVIVGLAVWLVGLGGPQLRRAVAVIGGVDPVAVLAIVGLEENRFEVIVYVLASLSDASAGRSMGARGFRTRCDRSLSRVCGDGGPLRDRFAGRALRSFR